LTVRDGGLARIYSDTSDSRFATDVSAELVTNRRQRRETGICLPPDLAYTIDEWVSERERYIAQRSRYDAKYFRRDVWAAEDLDNYGSWSSSKEYGW
jgi:hypothetical protein